MVAEAFNDDETFKAKLIEVFRRGGPARASGDMQYCLRIILRQMQYCLRIILRQTQCCLCIILPQMQYCLCIMLCVRGAARPEGADIPL
jgi:hypothetical protein